MLLGKEKEIRAKEYLFGVTLLLLASKYDELDDKIPYIKDFRHISSRSNFTWGEVTRCEDYIMKTLGWNLMVLSPENFTSALLAYGIVFSDEKLPSDREKFVKSVRMYTEMFTDIALQSTEI